MRSQRSGRRQPAARGEQGEGRIAIGRQRFAGAAPDRLRIGRPARVDLAEGLSRIERDAAQRGVLHRRRPCGEEARPVLASRKRRKPDLAEGFGDGLAAVARQEILAALRRQAIDVAAQRSVFDPTRDRAGRDRRRIVGLAGLGRLQRRQDLRVAGLGGREGRGGQRHGQQRGDDPHVWTLRGSYYPTIAKPV